MSERRLPPALWWVAIVVGWPVILAFVSLANGAALALLGGLPEPEAFCVPSGIGLVSGAVVGGIVGRAAALGRAPRRLWLAPVVWSAVMVLFEVGTDLIPVSVGPWALWADAAGLVMPVVSALMFWLAMSVVASGTAQLPKTS